MKYTLIVLLFICTTIVASAQKHRVFADVGIPAPGFSLTYNYKLTKHLGIGAGVQGYKFNPKGNTSMFIPAVYGDIRVNMRPEKNNQFFSFMDMGANLYKLDNNYYRDTSAVYYVPDNGFYTGLGFGYFRRISERGWGPYISMKLVLNWHTVSRYSLVSQDQDIDASGTSGILVLSLGFKF